MGREIHKKEGGLNIPEFDKCRVLVAGDLMIDEYLWGEVERISPEAPVPVVSVKKEEYTLGGAGNVVNNLIALGAKVYVAGVVGHDSKGEILVERFAEIGADTAGIIRDAGRPTTRKTRIIASHQQVLRIDREILKYISDEITAKLEEFIKRKILDVDVVLISDYGKGLLTNALLKTIITISQKHGKNTIADPKGLDFTKYSGVSLLTPNRKEASLASGIEILDESDLFKAGYRLLNTTGIESLLITCGKDGMVLFEKGKAPYKIKAQARQVYDVSGAGDTVLAVMGLGIGVGMSFAESAVIANAAASVVVGKVGTATVSKQELAQALESSDIPLKYKSFSDLLATVQDMKKKGKRVVLTNGCFDLLHVGHIRLFADSKKLGDILIVAIDDDASVYRLKGAGRPVITQQERVRILSALDSVDYVTVFSSDMLKTLIEKLKPDVLTKGSNYTSDKVFGREIVEQYRGKVVLIPITEDVSSSGIIRNIQRSREV